MKLNKTTLRFAATAVLFFLLLNFPLLSTANTSQLLFGIPNLYFFVFFIWLLVIIVAWRISKRLYPKAKSDESHE